MGTCAARPLTNPVWMWDDSLFKKPQMLETKRGAG